MLFKMRPCIQKNCNVYYPPTPSLGWIGQIKCRSLSMALARSASWLAYFLHPNSLTPIWSWMQGCTKPMPTHAHPCPPKTHGYGYGYGWAWAPSVGLWCEVALSPLKLFTHGPLWQGILGIKDSGFFRERTWCMRTGRRLEPNPNDRIPQTTMMSLHEIIFQSNKLLRHRHRSL